MTLRPPVMLPPESTRVGTESEVKIPVLTAAWAAIAADIVGASVFLIRLFWLLWKIGFRQSMEWIAATWGGWIIALVVPWAVAFALLAVTFAIQTIDKHAPSTRKAREAGAGILTAWFPGLARIVEPKAARRNVDEDYDRAFGGDDDE